MIPARGDEITDQDRSEALDLITNKVAPKTNFAWGYSPMIDGYHIMWLWGRQPVGTEGECIYRRKFEIQYTPRWIDGWRRWLVWPRVSRW